MSDINIDLIRQILAARQAKPSYTTGAPVPWAQGTDETPEVAPYENLFDWSDIDSPPGEPDPFAEDWAAFDAGVEARRGDADRSFQELFSWVDEVRNAIENLIPFIGLTRLVILTLIYRHHIIEAIVRTIKSKTTKSLYHVMIFLAMSIGAGIVQLGIDRGIAVGVVFFLSGMTLYAIAKIIDHDESS